MLAKYGTFKYGTEKYGAEREFSVGIKTTPVMIRNRILDKVLSCIILASTSIKKHTGKTLTSTVKSTHNIQRSIFKTMSFPVKTFIGTTKDITKTMSTNVKTVPIMARAALFFKELSSSLVATSNATKQARKNLIATVKITHSIQRNIDKIIAVGVRIPISTVKSIIKTMSTNIKTSARAIRMWPTYKQLFSRFFVITYRIKMEVIGLAISGNTITLRAEFPDSAGDLTLLGDVTLKIYGPGKILLETMYATEEKVGTYSGIYKIPEDKLGQYEFEFSGLIGGKTITDRSSFDANWK